MRSAPILHLRCCDRFLCATWDFLSYFVFARLRAAFLETSSISFTRFHVAEHSAYGIWVFYGGLNRSNLPLTWFLYAHEGFIVFNFDDFLVGENIVAWLDFNRDNGCLGHRFAELW